MTRKKIALALFFLVALVGLGFLAKVLVLDRRVNAFSGLKIDSIPQADVYIDNKPVGKTPYENSKLTPGEYSLKLSVSGTPGSYYPWETKIKLVPQSLTYVNRIIGKTDSESGHQIVWLEKLANPKTKELAVVSTPDGATIEVDGLDEGSTSKIITNLSEGDHTIIVSKDGYSDQTIDGKIVPGFRLNVSVKLSKAGEEIVLKEKIATTSAKPATSSAATKPATQSGSTSTNPPVPYVLVEDTGLGFLRVRQGPSASESEIARVNVGDKLPLLSEQSGWTQIKFSTASGWVSDQYIQKFK